MNALLLALALLAAPPESKRPAAADGGTSAAPKAGRFVAVSPASVNPVTVKPGIRARVLLTAASTGASDAAVATLELDAGAQVAAHRHTGAELLYIAEGTGELAGGTGVATPVGPGQIVYSAPNAAHQLRATTALALVAFYVPGGPELRFLGQTDPGTRPATPEDSKADPAPLVFDSSKIKSLKILKGQGTVRIVIDQANAPAAKAAFSVIELAPKAKVPEYTHPRQTEVFYFLEGEGEISYDDAKLAVTAPMAVHIPPGMRHSLQVTSKTRMRVLQLYTAAEPAQRVKPAAK